MKKAIILVLLLCILSVPCWVYAEDETETQANPPVITDGAAILMDMKHGNILFEKDAHKRLYPASTTKILTAIIALERGNLADRVTATSSPVTQVGRGTSIIWLNEGEVLTLEQLLYGLMLPSGNDAAVAIAEHISGSIDEFVRLMNEKAKEIGAINSNFANPHGLHDDNHYTTAYDMAIIARYAMLNLPKFKEIVGTSYYSLPPTNKQEEERKWHNSNKMLHQSSKYYYEYATGIKTGYTSQAGNALVSSANKDGFELLAVVLNNKQHTIYPNTRALFEYGFFNYIEVNLIDKGQDITQVEVKNVAVEEEDMPLVLVSSDEYSNVFAKDEVPLITKEITIDEQITAPISKGQPLGRISYHINGKELMSIDLVANRNVAEKNIVNLIKPKKELPLWVKVLAILLLLYLLLRIIKAIIRKKRRQKRFYGSSFYRHYKR
ncbi:MAG: D-alanyl-D-alanine carboxypeptidase family protein [Mahellales bacterium]|jgi:D-alanyl-D-alanine carboxypeptidase (penicillin-binding protein 5/6)